MHLVLLGTGLRLLYWLRQPSDIVLARGPCLPQAMHVQSSSSDLYIQTVPDACALHASGTLTMRMVQISQAGTAPLQPCRREAALQHTVSIPLPTMIHVLSLSSSNLK